MYYVYILKSLNFPKTYVGMTNNVVRRLAQHNSGYHFYTKRYLPWEIMYTETSESREQARIREKYYKSAAGRRWIRYNLFAE